MVALLTACGQGGSDSEEVTNLGPQFSAGSFTVFDSTDSAYSHAFFTLTGDELSEFMAGKSLFDRPWVTAPSSTEARDGLGPYFNARSCVDCHFKDGRGAPPESGETFKALLLRLSIVGDTDTGAPLGDPIYGGQFQVHSILDVETEGDASVTYTEISGTYGDGESYTLLQPEYTLSGLNYGAHDGGLMISPRIGNAIIGLGLLEDVAESDILAFADESDSDGDGISGKPNYVWNVRENMTTLGRFGWKANQPTVEQQVAGAFNGDIGITSSLFPTEGLSTVQSDATADIPNGGEPEISDEHLEFVVTYTESLSVPGRRDVDDPTVLAGEALFSELNCTACHRTEMVSRGQIIRPYTDLLLHDMGEGLADNRPDFEANGREWRTAPLWGIGLVETVNGHTRFLHDGRARNLSEAILWHGGEAEVAKEAFRNLPSDDRAALIAFLESL
jgi:CxxC motif-containing protein (DUF1111 family)